jgi:flagellar motor switch protein FliN/FliY
MSPQNGAIQQREKVVAPLLDAWVEALAQVIESMAGERTAASWQPAEAPGGPAAIPDDPLLWWEQPLEGVPDATIWVGSPAATWQHAGALTLKAAGLETAEAQEARNTWLEILSQSLAVLARSISAVAKREVLCGAGLEHPSPSDEALRFSATLAFAGSSLPPLTIVFGAGLAALLGSTSQSESGATAPASVAAPPPTPPRTSRTMELLLDVELPVSISFGKTRLPLRDVLQLTTGSIVELNRTATDPVDLLVNQRLIARGEVVVVDGNYGVRIQEIASRQDRLRSIP